MDLGRQMNFIFQLSAVLVGLGLVALVLVPPRLPISSGQAVAATQPAVGISFTAVPTTIGGSRLFLILTPMGKRLTLQDLALEVILTARSEGDQAVRLIPDKKLSVKSSLADQNWEFSALTAEVLADGQTTLRLFGHYAKAGGYELAGQLLVGEMPISVAAGNFTQVKISTQIDPAASLVLNQDAEVVPALPLDN